MRFSILGSGSKGNSTLVEHDGFRILVDAGFSARELTKRLHLLGLKAHDINALFITHAHSDHSKGAPRIAGSMNIPTFATSKAHMACHKVGGLANWNALEPGQPMRLGPFDIMPVAVKHDSPGTVAFVIEADGHRLGIITDLGNFNDELVAKCQELDVLYLEFNHDLEMLYDGPYPVRLKRRVASDYGHLNNVQAGQLLQQLVGPRLQKVMLAHLSEVNNTPELAFHEAHKALEGRDDVALAIAPQHAPSIWVEVNAPAGLNETASLAMSLEVSEETLETAQEDVTVPLAVRHQVALFSG